jgi:hypothetical protein
MSAMWSFMRKRSATAFTVDRQAGWPPAYVWLLCMEEGSAPGVRAIIAVYGEPEAARRARDRLARENPGGDRSTIGARYHLDRREVRFR